MKSKQLVLRPKKRQIDREWDFGSKGEAGNNVSFRSLHTDLLITSGLARGIWMAFSFLRQQIKKMAGRPAGQHAFFLLLVYAPDFAIFPYQGGYFGSKQQFSGSNLHL